MLRIRIRKILASWIRIRKNMRIHGSGSKGQNINQKLQQKKNYYQTQIWTIDKREIIKISWFQSTDSRDFKQFSVLDMIRRFKGYLSTLRVTWNYVYSPFKAEEY